MDTASKITIERFAWRNDAAGTFRRPLGNTELGFYWDSVFNGVAAVVNQVVLETSPEVASRRNVEAAWLRLKERFPMLGAFVEERTVGNADETETVDFVVDERRLATLQPEEINFMDADLVSDVQLLTNELQNAAPKLSNNLICQIWFIRRKDVPGRYHFICNAVHYITDGMAGSTIIREFCHELALLSPSSSRQVTPLQQRLQSLLPMEALNPGLSLSLPRRRWRLAIAKVLYDNRQARLTGGQTIPTKSQKSSLGQPPVSRTLTLRLSLDISNKIVRTCRSLGITFGNALPILSQLAHARVLHRRRFHSTLSDRSIGDEEWDHRRLQPTHFGGPLNVRPYLDRHWYENGGAEEVCLAISFYFLELPFLPTFPRPQSPYPAIYESASASDTSVTEPSEVDALVVGPGQRNSSYSPPFFTFLSPQRFLHRAMLVRSQSARVLKHPLINEVHLVRTVDRIRRAKAAGLAWHRRADPIAQSSEDVPSTFNHSSCVFANGGASLGNRDLIVPLEYPLRGRVGVSDTEVPRLRVVDSIVDLRCRPSELYLGALTSHGSLHFFCYADINTYDEEVVREWVQEVVNAAIAYLGKGAMDGLIAGAKL